MTVTELMRRMRPMENIMTYRQACRLVRSVGMDIEDGLALTFSCADYPDWVREMNGYDVESAAAEIASRRGAGQ